MEKNTDFKPVLLSLINLLHLAVTSKMSLSLPCPLATVNERGFYYHNKLSRKTMHKKETRDFFCIR